ncbi:MAG: 2-oxo acid dehydrogenase subunit E2 [Bacteroidetes bacterium]|nr:2-oxo acid dehydrogenase subunit E2 [Bacteroidota bacterium]MBT3935019.1 2-oxo acid dehydrogenase subunit E2 [Bacteroidota bacterium]
MRYIFNFPDIGEGLDEGTIAEWYVEKGHQVKSGDPLVKMETDKVVTDIPSPKTGTIVAVYGHVGDTIHVGNPLVEVEIEGIEGEAAQDEAKTDLTTEPIEEGAGVVGTLEVAGNAAFLPSSTEGIAESKTDEKKTTQKALATPVARAMAKDLGIDINQVSGTGPGGRVIISDVKKFHESFGQASIAQTIVPDQTERVTYEPLTQIRKAIARNMLASKQNVPHMTVHDEVEVTELIHIRAKFKEEYAKKEVKLSYLPFVVKATALALKKFRTINAQLDMENERMIFKNYVNIGIAADTEDGLVVPVIKDADKKSIFELANEINEIAKKASKRELRLEDMQDGTFTITNYGSIGGMHANPIINYPQAGILGVGRLVKKPVVVGNEIIPGTIQPLSLAVDHRIVDGGDVTRFLNQIMEFLADPISMLMD